MNPISLQRDGAKPTMAPQQPQMGYPAGGMQQPMMNQQPGMGQQGMMNNQQPMMGQQPGMMNQQPGMGQQPMMGQQMGQQPGMMNQQPGMMGQQPGVMNQQPGMMNQQPGMMGQQPGMMGQQPGMMGQQPGMMGQQPGMMGQQPVGMNPPLNRVSLVKGQNMSLTKAAPSLRQACVGLGWDVRQTSGAAFDLDASCFMLNANNQVANPQNFIFYNNKQSMDGSVMSHGDNLTGQGEGDDEQVSVDLSRVPMDVQRIVFVCSIYEAEQRQQNFGMVQRAFIRVVDKQNNQEIVRFDLTEEGCMWSCMLFGELYRYGQEWKFKALGQGIQGGLKAAGAQFGMQLA